jgi:hypothetical protein
MDRHHPIKHPDGRIRIPRAPRQEQMHIALDRTRHHRARSQKAARGGIENDLVEGYDPLIPDEPQIICLRELVVAPTYDVYTPCRGILDRLYHVSEDGRAVRVFYGGLELGAGEDGPVGLGTELVVEVGVDAPRGGVVGFPRSADEGARQDGVERGVRPAPFAPCRLPGVVFGLIEFD